MSEEQILMGSYLFLIHITGISSSDKTRHSDFAIIRTNVTMTVKTCRYKLFDLIIKRRWRVVNVYGVVSSVLRQEESNHGRNARGDAST